MSNMDLIQNIALIIIAAVNVCIGLIFLFQKKDEASISFGITVLSVAVWSFGLSMFRLVNGLEVAIIWAKIYYSAAALIAASFFYFSFAFPIKNDKKLRFIKAFTIVLTGIILSLIFSNLITKDIAQKDWGKEITLGPAYYFYTLFFVILMVWAFAELFYKYLRSQGLVKMQLRYVLLGTVFSTIFGALFNLFLPLYHNYRLIWAGPCFTVILVFFITYAITRYRLMDIRLVIRRSMAYAIMVIFTYGFFYFGVWLLKKMFGSVYTPGAFITTGFLAIIALALFFLFEKTVNYIADRYFFVALHNQHETLKNFSKELTTIIDLEKLVSSICGVIKKTLDLDRISFVLKDFSSDAFKNKKVIGFEKAEINSFIKNVDISSVFGKNPRPLIYEELEVKKFFHCKKNMEFIDAYLLLPLISRHKLQGIIITGRRKMGDAFSQEDIRLLETLSHQAALAVENARLYDQMHDFNVTLEEKVNEQTKDIREKNARLRRLLAMKTEFLRIASHQLRTPVSAIKGLVSMLEDGDFDDADMETKKKVFNGIFKKTEKMTNVLDDILTATELDTIDNFKLGKDELMDTDIDEMTGKIINDLKFDAEEKNISVSYKSEMKDHGIVKSNQRDLRHILINLLSNAINYTRSGGRVEVFVSSDPKAGKIKWEIRDNGIGVPKNSRIYEKFKRCANAIELNRDGSGLGLFIVKKLVSAHPGGEVGFSSKEGDGSSFWVKLPAGDNNSG